jgi:hypothetical protein
MRLLRWPIHISVNLEWPVFIRRAFARAIEPVVVDSIQLRHFIRTETDEPDSLVAVLEFNGNNSDPNDPEYVDLNQLKSSLHEDGTFFIWTCSCGAPGCAGMFDGVAISHIGDTTSWHDLDCKRKFTFKSTDLRDAFNRGIIDGRNLLTETPRLKPTPEQNDTAYRNDG